MRYEYYCEGCHRVFEEDHKIEYRDLPCTFPCSVCGEYEVVKKINAVGISVPEGGCGNAANGYASTHGDSENFKAKSKGEPPVFDKPKKR